MYPLVLII